MPYISSGAHRYFDARISLAGQEEWPVTGRYRRDVHTLSDNPKAGDMMAGTGGARKLRHAGKGKDKSGGYRTIHYFGGDDVPVFLLSVYGKGVTDNLTKAERNMLAKILPQLADAYRQTAKRMAGEHRRKI